MHESDVMEAVPARQPANACIFKAWSYCASSDYQASSTKAPRQDTEQGYPDAKAPTRYEARTHLVCSRPRRFL